MSNQTKFITSHTERLRRAKEYASRFPVKLSRFDLEAFVEFYLVEDIRRLYEYRHTVVKSRKKTTREGVFYQKKQLEKINYLIYMLDKCLDVLEGKLDDGAYSDVWRAIREHQLKVAAGNLTYLDELIKLTEGMLKEVDDEALLLAQKMLGGNEFMEELEAHDANARKVMGIPEDYGVEVNTVVEPKSDSAKDKKTNPNLN